jgi:hypothetical protein
MLGIARSFRRLRADTRIRRFFPSNCLLDPAKTADR